MLKTFLFSLLVLFAQLASAGLEQQLNHCRHIKNEQTRLTCYDAITAESETSQAVSERPEKQYIPPLLADLDEANLVISKGSLDFLDETFQAMLFSVGKRQKIRDFNFGNDKILRFNAFGQIRSQFDLKELGVKANRGSGLINTDYLVGGEIEQSLPNWNWRLRYSHRSTHLGDEFLIDNQEYLTERVNLSYETISWTAHKNFNNWDIYGGISYIVRSEPSSLGKTAWQLGWQYQTQFKKVKPIWAVDLKSWQAADWNIDLTMRAGIEIGNLTATPFQILLEYQDGRSPYGQFYTDDSSYWGVSFLQNW